eukprot:3640769-Alexandrium_andersonii.AAC.1
MAELYAFAARVALNKVRGARTGSRDLHVSLAGLSPLCHAEPQSACTLRPLMRLPASVGDRAPRWR